MGTFVFTLFADVFAIRECVDSAVPNAYVRRQGDEGYAFAVSRSLYPEPAPSWLVEVNSAEEVQAVVKCASEAGLKVCPRTGGHSFTGQGQCTGVMIDLIKLKSFSFDAGSNEITVGGGNTLGEMFLKTDRASGGSQMIGIGLCPSVGVAGYVLGGGHNPYSGAIGLTCESAVSYDYVLADGSLKTVTSSSDPELFWASCGGGGNAFGILTSVTFRTTPAAKFNNNVYFRYKWPNANAAETIHKYMDYDNEDGNVWIRLEMTLDGLVGYGVCWDSSSVENCEGRLGSAPFFNVAGRETLIAEKSSRVVDFQKWIGPAGAWATQIPTVSDSDAFIGTQYDEASVGLKRMYTSGLWEYGNSKPGIEVFQQQVDIMLSTDRLKVAWMLAQYNPWDGANKANADKFAFPHRFQDAFTEFIGGNDNAEGDDVQATLEELERVQRALLGTMQPWKSGIYVNYPEFGLGEDEYGYLYWGSNLQRLSTLRASLDPTALFAGKQSLGRGELSCPGSLSISGSGAVKTILIVGYPFGQLGGMKTEMQLGDGCSLVVGNGAQLTNLGPSKYEAVVDGGAGFTIKLSSASCDISVVTINGISCTSTR